MEYTKNGSINIEQYLNNEVPQEIGDAAATIYYTFSSEKDADEWLERVIMFLNGIAWGSLSPDIVEGAKRDAKWATDVAEDATQTPGGSIELWGNITSWFFPLEAAS